VSVVKYSDIDLGDRFDAEYFSKNGLKIQNILSKKEGQPLGSFGTFVGSAFYPSAVHLYEIGDTPFIRCVDCINFPFITRKQDSNFERLPLSFIFEQGGIQTLKKGDMVITKVGSPCYASLVEEHDLVALSRTVLGIQNIRNINPYYLLIFLRSRYGFEQLLRQRELTIQFQLTLPRVKSILVYPSTPAFQQLIEEVVKRYHLLLEKSKTLYSQAQQTLLQALGLTDIAGLTDGGGQVVKSEVSINSSLFSSGRLDAEFYQPKYDSAFKALTNGRNARLFEIAHLTKGFQARSLSEFGTLYASIKDCYNYSINTEERTDELDLVKVEPADIVLAITGATIGKTALNQLTEQVAISGDLVGIKPYKISPYYLLTVLSSTLIQALCNRYTTGATNGHLAVSDVAEFPIPLCSDAIRDEISEFVRKSFQLRNQSKILLEAAKRAIEIAIETNEEAAIKWLNETTNQI